MALRNRKKPTKGFSELNKRTYDASPQGKEEIRSRVTKQSNSNQYNQSFYTGQKQATGNSYYSQNDYSQNYSSQPQRQTQTGTYGSYQQQNAFASAPTGQTRVGQAQTPYNGQKSYQNGGASFSRQGYSQSEATSHTRQGYSQNGATPHTRQGYSQSGAQRGVSNGSQNNELSEFSRDRYSAKHKEQTKMARRKRRRRIIFVIAAAILAALIGGGIALANIFGNMNEGMDNIGLTPTQYANQPFYMVLMGVDSSSDRKGDSGTDSDFRSDSIMLARIDPVEKKVSLVSLHRDVEVDMGEYGTQKLNAAHSLGGPELVIKTVSKLAGVPINHYAEINFDGFKAAVDKLGGVDVEVPMEINDPQAGGYVPAGQQHLNGEQALILCRARHAYDDYGDGDKYRAANQRTVLSAIAKKALSSDILTIAQTVTELSNYIKTDLGLNDMIGLAQVMKDIDPATSVYSAMMPTTPEYKDGVWYEKLNETEWKEMMQRMDQGLPPSEETYVDPQTGTVMSNSGGSNSNSSSNSEAKMSGSIAVRNGTTTEGKAATAATKLENLGFKTDVANANSTDYSTTVIVYTNDSQKATAEAIKDALGCGKVEKNNNEYVYSTDYLVVVGTDYKS